MRADALDTYLNNHLTAAVGALSLLEMLASDGDATHRRADIAQTIHNEIAAEKQTLEDLMHIAGIEKKTLRNMLGWLGEKAAELKLRWDDPSGGALHQLEAVEALCVAVRGKWLLWQGLDHARAQGRPELDGFDFENLMLRSDHQRQQLDAWRLDLITRAF